MSKSRIVWSQQKRLIEHFSAGSTAHAAASLAGLNKTTASDYFLRLVRSIYEHSEEAGFLKREPKLMGVISVDRAKVSTAEKHQVELLHLAF